MPECMQGTETRAEAGAEIAPNLMELKSNKDEDSRVIATIIMMIKMYKVQ